MNHNGYSSLGTPGFVAAGGYPGLAITLPNDIDGDFHSAFAGGDQYERLAGLIDIAHEKNHRFIRSPVDPADARNIRAGKTPAFGRLANVPDPANRRFYPDRGHDTIFVFDPKTGEANIPVHAFNLNDPTKGDPVVENATGYLMRNAQWLIQVIGVDGLRIDAAKHVQGFVLDFIDRAVYRQNPRRLLDGSQKDVFTYSEVYDANPAVLLPHVRKDINHADPGRIGGNRDTLDFKLYFALKENLESTATIGAWQTIKNAALDVADDGLHNGSAGVTFIQSHDVFKPFALENVAQAYTLMMPGNTVVYFNGREFGNRDFPKPGRGDALSVREGSLLTRLIEARNTHGRGNYVERWDGTDGLFAFERESSAIVLLSNRGDAGFDSRTLTQVGFAPGTLLLELTGNAADPRVNPDRGGTSRHPRGRASLRRRRREQGERALPAPGDHRPRWALRLPRQGRSRLRAGHSGGPARRRAQQCRQDPARSGRSGQRCRERRAAANRHQRHHREAASKCGCAPGRCGCSTRTRCATCGPTATRRSSSWTPAAT